MRRRHLVKRSTRFGALLVTASIAVPGLVDGSAGAAAPHKKSPPKVTVLVTNDDGVGAPGIDALVEALRREKRTKVVVVAPQEGQTGLGNSTTPGGAPGAPATTASDYPATAVGGFPLDAVDYAFDVLEVTPNVVISGINSVQNLGPVSEVSGTVGAARRAAQRGIPALAVSAQLGTPDYPTSARLAVKWLRKHRARLAKKAKVDGPAPTEIESINAPTCPGGPRGLYETVLAPDDTTEPVVTRDVDCDSGLTSFANDVQAFNHGYATITKVAVPTTAG